MKEEYNYKLSQNKVLDLHKLGIVNHNLSRNICVKEYTSMKFLATFPHKQRNPARLVLVDDQCTT